MSDNSKTKNLIVRAVSAIVAVAILSIGTWLWGVDTLRVACILAVLIGTRELSRILFQPEDSTLIKTLFYLMMLFVFGLTAYSLSFSALAFAFVSIVFFSSSLWLQKRFHSLHALSMFQAKGILGFLYMGLLPGFAFQLTNLEHGLIWFLGMLGFVFAGDTFAYIFGMSFGKTLLMPSISPKKTVEGALGGLFGSVAAACILVYFFPQFPLAPVMTLAGLAGLAGQMGDLFESLLKRVANRKDSGRIMPGHGGLLDRIDGVLFASPVVLIGAMLIEAVIR